MVETTRFFCPNITKKKKNFPQPYIPKIYYLNTIVVQRLKYLMGRVLTNITTYLQTIIEKKKRGSSGRQPRDPCDLATWRDRVGCVADNHATH